MACSGVSAGVQIRFRSLFPKCLLLYLLPNTLSFSSLLFSILQPEICDSSYSIRHSWNVAASVNPCGMRKEKREKRRGLVPPSWNHSSTEGRRVTSLRLLGIVLIATATAIMHAWGLSHKNGDEKEKKNGLFSYSVY